MNKKTIKLLKKYRFVYLLITPVLLYFCIFSYLPMLLGIVQSFQKSKLLGSVEWVGFENYSQVLRDPLFLQSVKNGLVIGCFTLFGSMLMALLTALGLNELKHASFKMIVQTASYLPYLFSWTVVGGIWIYILSANGLFNGVLKFFSQKSILFLSEQRYAQLIMVLTGIWKVTGYYAVLLIASIVTIPDSLFEAAQLDHASREKQIVKIILPELFPTMKTVFLIGVMGLFANFDQIFVMKNSAIVDQVRTPMLYIYENGILHFNIGISTAAAVLVLAMTLLLTTLCSKLMNRKGEQ